MNTLMVTWFDAEQYEFLDTERVDADTKEYMLQYLKMAARAVFDRNPGTEVIKAAVIDADSNDGYVLEFEKKPVAEYEILITEH